MSRQLTRNFSLSEMVVTNTGIPNKPTEKQIKNILWLLTYIGQPIRNHCGRLKVSSSFRSLAVNRKIGSGDSSQHTEGEAMDFSPLDMDIVKVYEWIVYESGIKFGSCILEHKSGKVWIHISLPRLNKNNQMALLYKDGKYTPYKRS